MARFQIEKGERFSLNKSEGLEKVRVDLNWKSGADLDASAFLIGDDGLIGDDADFVFYNSAKRANPETGEFEPFDKGVHGTKRNGRAALFLFRQMALCLAQPMTLVMVMMMVTTQAK